MKLRKFKDIEEASDFFELIGMTKEFNSIIDDLKKVEESMADGYAITFSRLADGYSVPYSRVLKRFLVYWNVLLSPARFSEDAFGVIPSSVKEILVPFMDEVENKQLNAMIGKRNYEIRSSLVKDGHEVTVLSIDFASQTVICYDAASGDVFTTPLITANLKFELGGVL